MVARLTGFPFAPAPSRQIQAIGNDGRLRATAAEIAQRGHERADSAFAQGIVAALDRRFDDAAQVMSAAAATDPSHWTDLAAVLYERGVTENDPQLLASALVAADAAATASPSAPEPLFNRALILEALGLFDAASRQFDVCQRFETDSRWISEVAHRRDALRRTFIEDDWRNKVLPQLRAAAIRSDAQQILDIVEKYPQQARTWTEGIFFTEWADAYHKDKTADAERALRLARATGTALSRLTGDSFILDAIAAIDEGDRSQRSAIAIGQLAYFRGRSAFAMRQVTEALPSFDEARREFQVGKTPMAFAAAQFSAAAVHDSNEGARARALVEELQTELPDVYLGRRAELLWLQGTMLGTSGSLYRSLESYRDAKRLFARLGETLFAAQMSDFAAQMLTLLGRDAEAARLRREAFLVASNAADNALVESMLTQAAGDAAYGEKWDVAQSFFSLALDAPVSNGRRRVHNLLGSAVAYWRTGSREEATNRMARAYLAAQSLKDASLRASAVHDTDAIRAILIRDDDPATSFALLSDAIEFAESTKTIGLPRLLLERARTARRLDHPVIAIDDLEAAIAEIERRRSDIEGDDLRDAFLGSSLEVYDELFDVVEAGGDLAHAFMTAERERGRLIADRFGDISSTHAELRRAEDGSIALRRSTALVHYTSLPDRLVVFVIDARGAHHIRVAVTRQALLAATLRLKEALKHDNDAVRRASTPLWNVLIAPIEARIAAAADLVIVADDITSHIPFSALAPKEGTFATERWNMTMAPSVTAYVRMRAQGAASPEMYRAFVVGDPAFGTRHADLPRLPGAFAEAEQVAHLYGVRALNGSDATRDAFARGVNGSDVVHIAAHAIIDNAEPDRSSIVFADGDLTIREIARATGKNGPVVVLAGCRTGVRARRSDLSSLASAFLATGSRAVVATLWDLPDGQAGEIGVLFHRYLRQGDRPAAALAHAQRDLIHSGRAPYVWSAFQLYGTD